jgi:hypothetical protein
MSTADDDIRDDGGTQTVDLARYRAKRMRHRLALTVERLLKAIDQRDPERVWALLDDPEAYRYIPSNVREEALAMAQLPHTSLRAPVRLYRYQYLLGRLGDEPLDEPFDLSFDRSQLAIDQSQVAIDFTPAPIPVTEQPAAGRELPFRERRSPDGGPPRRGGDRRRTGAR